MATQTANPASRLRAVPQLPYEALYIGIDVGLLENGLVAYFTPVSALVSSADIHRPMADVVSLLLPHVCHVRSQSCFPHPEPANAGD